MQTSFSPTPTGKIESTATPMLINGSNVQSEITFTNARPCEPLPPLVQAYYFSETNSLQVSAVVFLAQNENPETLFVNYTTNPDGTPVFTINYDDAEIETKTFYGFQVNFEIAIEGQPKTIEAYVYDTDPVTSRGTIVTVQP